MIHTIQINYTKSKSTLLEYGIEIQEQKTKPNALRILSLNETSDTLLIVSQSTLPKDVNFDHNVYTIIGINGQSCRGLGLLQADQLLNKREDDRETSSSTRDVVDQHLVLLIRGGKVTLTKQTDDCLCGKGCTSEYPADCCNIQ